MAVGTVADIEKSPDSLTGQYLSGRKQVPFPEKRREGNGLSLTVTGARENNLQGIDVEFPLGRLVCITGVSGSGKSSLVYEILYKKLNQRINNGRDLPGKHDDLLGVEGVDKVVKIDQSPIGRTPRSNPATYTGAFTPVRELFANLPESRVRGYKPGRFSFNVKGGRCEACQGEGYNQIEMQFLPDVTVPCEICHGLRYNREALEVTMRGKHIADVLNMTVDTASEFFVNFPRISPKLKTMRDVGLGYIKLGQPATTLSGGEAQRVKLATELSKRATGKTVYLLDEPTTGLSFEDCAALLGVLHRLVDAGNTVILIEHNIDVMKNADWLIDLGPGAGDKGGELIATGTPEQLADHASSVTAPYLKAALGQSPRLCRPAHRDQRRRGTGRSRLASHHPRWTGPGIRKRTGKTNRSTGLVSRLHSWYLMTRATSHERMNTCTNSAGRLSEEWREDWWSSFILGQPGKENQGGSSALGSRSHSKHGDTRKVHGQAD